MTSTTLVIFPSLHSWRQKKEVLPSEIFLFVGSKLDIKGCQEKSMSSIVKDTKDVRPTKIKSDFDGADLLLDGGCTTTSNAGKGKVLGKKDA